MAPALPARLRARAFAEPVPAAAAVIGLPCVFLARFAGAARVARARATRRRGRGDGPATMQAERSRQLRVREVALAVVLRAVEVALLQALRGVVAPAVVGDRDRGHLRIGERGFRLPADALQRRAQRVDALGERSAEVGIAPLEEVVGISLEELQVELEDAEAMAELVGSAAERWRGCSPPRRRAWRGSRTSGRRRHRQRSALSFKRARPPVGVASIVSPTRLRMRRQCLAAQRRPDPAGLLAGERDDHVDAERRARHGGLDRWLELLLEPEGILRVRHVPRFRSRCNARWPPGRRREHGRCCAWRCPRAPDRLRRQRPGKGCFGQTHRTYDGSSGTSDSSCLSMSLSCAPVPSRDGIAPSAVACARGSR